MPLGDNTIEPLGQLQPAATVMPETTDADYIANTFSKFGLNINLLIGGGGGGRLEDDKADPSGDDNNTGLASIGGKSKHSKKFDELLDAIPDFTYLTEASVSMGQLFV